MSDIAAFILARLDEDEAAARGVQDNSAPWPGRWVVDDDHAVKTYNGWTIVYGDLPPGLAAHMVRNSPARVLREVDAKRAIAALHKGEPSMHHEPPRPERYCAACGVDDGWYNVPWPCPTILAVAAIYGDHPDYQPEWKPS
jgi:hypothetical protein